MTITKRAMTIAMAASLGFTVAACGDSEDDPVVDAGPSPVDMGTPDMGTPDMGTPDMGMTGFEQPANTVPVNFVVDDSATQVYTAEAGLAWKGSMNFDAETRIATYDAGWGGPFPLLYDDGPWNEGGHEPAGAVAGDNVWGVTVFVEIPTEADLTLEFGLIRGSVDGSDGEWIFSGGNLNPPSEGNGQVTIPIGQTDAVDAGTYTIPGGQTDLRITLDTTAMEEPFLSTFDASAGDIVQIKSSKWGWALIDMSDAGEQGDLTADDQVWTFVLSENVGAGTDFPFDALFGDGERAEFVLNFQLAGNSVEYKPEGEPGSIVGVTAEFSADGGTTWTPVTIGRAGNDNNPAVTAPSGGSGTPFEQPANTVPVNFVVDDSATQVYTAEAGLAWKGSMNFDAESRVVTYDAGWGGPFPLLYDDGPWNQGGHEPAGAVAGDNVWGVTIFAEIPTEADLTLEFGLIRGSVDGSDGEWIFSGGNLNPPSEGNGQVTIPIGQIEAVNAGTYTIPGGQTDLRITLDTTAMEEPFVSTFDASAGDIVQIKSSKWGWSLIDMSDAGERGDVAAGDLVWTFQLSEHVGPGTNFPYDALFGTEERAEFVLNFQLAGNSVEYKPEGEPGSIVGVTAEFSTDGGATWSPSTIGRAGNDDNPAVTAP